MNHRQTVAVVIVAAGSMAGGARGPGPAAAQEDFRAADRPLRVEDAFPAKHREWELEAGLLGGWGEEDEIEGVVELKVGAFPNGQAGVELHGGRASSDGDDAAGLESAALHLLYNLNRETWRAPAFAARLEAGTPGAGDLGREAWAWTATAIATRSFDRLRAHANVGRTWADADDGGDFWRAGIALDYPIGLFGRSLLGDVYAEIPADDGDARVWTTVGSRWQLTNDVVLDLGVGTRLDRWADGESSVELVVGISRVFGIPALVDVPSYPDPRID